MESLFFFGVFGFIKLKCVKLGGYFRLLKVERLCVGFNVLGILFVIGVLLVVMFVCVLFLGWIIEVDLVFFDY